MIVNTVALAARVGLAAFGPGRWTLAALPWPDLPRTTARG
jgi:hypothetical protein